MSIIRPNVDRVDGYTPGEQPQESGWVKLNTNENPYPPSPRVVAAIRVAAAGPLNKYPDPLSRTFCLKAAQLFNVDPDCILPANGSDENLTILLRTFVDPDDLVSYPYPSYILYETLADLQGGRHARLQLNADWSWDHNSSRRVVEQSKLVIVPNPSSPSGNRWADGDLLRLVPPKGILVLDEAYGDFCDPPHQAQLLARPEGRRIVITRSLSKSYSLAGVRFGFAIADAQWIYQMRKVKDSYNCDTLSLAAALAALDDQAWMLENCGKIRATRGRLSGALAELGFDVVPSQSNFVWATHPAGRHREIYEALKEKRILVRYMRFPETQCGDLDGLRITVGTDAEIDTLLAALKTIV